MKLWKIKKKKKTLQTTSMHVFIGVWLFTKTRIDVLFLIHDYCNFLLLRELSMYRDSYFFNWIQVIEEDNISLLFVCENFYIFYWLQYSSIIHN